MPFPPCQDPCAAVNAQEGGGCVLVGKGLGTDGASWDLPGTGLEKETLEVKDGVSSPGRFRICS